jgi:CRISPR-associated endonuclease/helicase Cas3
MSIPVDAIYAHTLANRDETEWEPLDVHLTSVAEMAERYTSAFTAVGWGRVLGECHDLGKASAEFQAKLHAANLREAQDAGVEDSSAPHRVDHSTFGARYVKEYFGPVTGELLAYCIAGHHAGLPNGRVTEDASSRSTLELRLDSARIALPHVADPGLALPTLKMHFRPSDADMPFALAFFTRMLFSCLIDADRTCTERFCNPEQAAQRQVVRPSIADMESALRTHLDSMTATAPATEVNRQRAFVLQQCQLASTATPGFFSLQVPTGGGKTLSSLAFALSHAQANGLRRVVMAIPFTSIIEQTAEVYRRALGPLGEHGLVEHHTNLKPEHETRENQFATENWDAPLIVTTNVQLFESLFAARTSPCRKLHRLAGSVLILDEAQTLPVELLAPTLRALRELVLHYGCTVVLCTATQPAIERRDGFSEGIEGVRPIIADPAPLFAALRRVQVVRLPGRQTVAELASRIAKEDRTLVIVNTRAQAAELFTAVRDLTDPAFCFHLSTLMCGTHRRDVLQQIRMQVKVGPCRVISTQLVEAGVDLDFPVVFRAETGFDSIAQAAGRCNREGVLPRLGTTYVFEAEQPPPKGFLRDTAQTAQELWPHHPDPLAPGAIDAYFRHHYWRSADVLDKYEILPCMTIDLRRAKTRFQFREIEDKYKIIRATEVPILVPFDAKAANYLAQLQSPHVPFISQRLLQSYLVSVPERTFHALVRDHMVQLHESGVGLLLRPDAYSSEYGLRLEELGLDARLWSI